MESVIKSVGNESAGELSVQTNNLETCHCSAADVANERHLIYIA